MSIDEVAYLLRLDGANVTGRINAANATLVDLSFNTTYNVTVEAFGVCEGASQLPRTTLQVTFDLLPPGE